jgi:glucose-1-phosphate cytidylyltransferase
MNALQEMPPAVILCGGQGTRIRDVTEAIPKPMLTIGNRPIVWHIMKTYAAFGVRRFILCLGYRRESFVDYFLNYRSRAVDLTVRLQHPDDVTYHGRHEEFDWEVTLADTGEQTMTGGRVARIGKYLGDHQHCFLTYGDGVADVDIHDLWRHHQSHEKAATITAVRPGSRFGEIKLEGSRVASFHEKTQVDAGLINGGFMVLHRRFIDKYLSTDAKTVLEQSPISSAVADGEVHAYVHDGFWQCMDTAREYELLNHLWDTGQAPWTTNWTKCRQNSSDDECSSQDTRDSKDHGSPMRYVA